MSQIVFQKGGMSDLTLENGRSFPVAQQEQIYQHRYLTESMNPKVVDYGASASYLDVVIDGLTKDNYDGTVNGLKTWFEDANINWSENNFTMIDERGTSLTVRLWQSNFRMPMVAPNVYKVRMRFLKE